MTCKTDAEISHPRGYKIASKNDDLCFKNPVFSLVEMWQK